MMFQQRSIILKNTTQNGFTMMIYEGYVTVQILDKKIDTLFRLTWL